MEENNIREKNFEECMKCRVCRVYCGVIGVNGEYGGGKEGVVGGGVILSVGVVKSGCGRNVEGGNGR